MKTRSLVIAFKMSLRRNLKTNVLFALAAFALLSAAWTTRALARYPDRIIIRIVVPFPPGGGTDVVARTLAQESSASTKALS
jgi:tripartite-type tricarboxylate transporter receptor subunit TctC